MKINTFFVITCLASAPALASPDWYGKPSEDSSIIFGYGQGETYQQAKHQAYDDLATSVETRIISNTQLDEQFKDGKLTNVASFYTEANTDVVFRNNVVVANSLLDNERYYVALRYEKTSFYKRLAQWLEQAQCQSNMHPYWQNVSMMKNWISQNHCLPHIQVERFAGGWQLSHPEGELVLPDTQYDHLFFNHGSDVLSLKSTSNRLKQGDYYFVEMKTEKPGYLSLFQVYEDGTTGVLVENQYLSADQPVMFPDKNFYDGIEAMLPNGSTTFDINIALLCDKPIDTSRFEKLDETPLSTDEPGFNLILDYTQQCDYRMERLTITK